MNPEGSTAPPKETKHPSCTIGMSYSNGTKKSLVSLFKSHILAEDGHLFQRYLCVIDHGVLRLFFLHFAKRQFNGRLQNFNILLQNGGDVKITGLLEFRQE